MHYRVTSNLYSNKSSNLLSVSCKSGIGYHDLDTPGLPADSYSAVASLLNSLIPNEVQIQLVDLINQERECIMKRQQLIQQFRDDFHIIATEFASTLPTTHPELYL